MDKIRRGPYGKRKRELFDSSVTDVDLDDDHYIEIYSGAESAGHHSTHISSCVSDDISPVDLNVCDDISPKEQYETGQIGYVCVYEHNLDDGDNAEESQEDHNQPQLQHNQVLEEEPDESLSFLLSCDDLDYDETLGDEEDSMFEETLDENETDTSSFHKESEPLYPGASVTLGAVMLLLALFVTKHGLAGDAIQQLLSIIAVVLPHGNMLCATVYSFKLFFKNLKNPLIKHFYCGYCLGYLKDTNIQSCPYSTCGKTIKENKEYFLEMPVDNQLRNLLSQEGFYSNLQGRFRSENTSGDMFKDIYDGSLYRSYFENSGPLSNPDNVSFTFNTDGASVFKSSKVSVWPIFLVINELPYKLRMKKENMILAGLWFGNKKPSMGTFLQPFLEKFNELSQGIHITSPERGNFKMRGYLICATADLPARCLLCNSVQFNGNFSCWKCLQIGETASVGKGHCHIFPYKANGPKDPPRTKTSVNQDSRKAMDLQESGTKKYLVNGIKGPSWLTFFPKFDIVNGIAIDYMHGVLLGVQKLLLNLWFSDSHKSKPFSFHNKLVIVDRRLSGIKPTLTISRLPRPIHNELKYWKASEFRAFLLFYGAAVLNGILDNERFVHYLLLVNSIFILLKDGSKEDDIVEAERMLFQFVNHFSTLYNKCFMTLNMHQLLHLPDSVRHLGPLYTHSCFSFEDKNGVLLKMIRGTQNIDNQIITGVSFLQKLPELKNTTITKGSNIDDLYNSIEHPSILTRGLKLSDDVFILGAVKTKTLTDAEHNALCTCLGYAPLQEEFRYFKRLEYQNSLIYGTIYSRMAKRDNSAICYKSTDQDSEQFGKVRFFILLDNLTAYAVTEELKCKSYCKQHILAVERTNKLVMVEVKNILESCMFIQISESQMCYICRFPNVLEYD